VHRVLFLNDIMMLFFKKKMENLFVCHNTLMRKEGSFSFVFPLILVSKHLFIQKYFHQKVFLP
jgi:hypothetical protein